MNRRTALKNLTMSLGYTVAAPTIFNMLASCNAKAESWTPLFLSAEEKHVVTHLVDIIIPATEIPGALDVNVPQFIDLMYHDIEKESNKTLFKIGANVFSEIYKAKFNQDPIEGNKKGFELLLTKYFTLSDKETDQILKTQKVKPEKISNTDKENYSLYKFLLSVRYYAIFGYCTSEEVGEHVLAYDPIPGVYKGCISIEEATKGKVWSL